MTRNELQADMEKLTANARALMGNPEKAEEFKSLTEKIRTAGEQVRAIDAAEAELRAVKDAESRTPSPVAGEIRAGWRTAANQIKALVEGRAREGVLTLGIPELRAITSNGAGVNTAPGIIKALVDGGKLRSRVSLFPGKNAQTVVPVFSPHMAIPVGSVPGATGTASDSTAALTGDPLTLKAWYSTLQISMGALLSTDIEAYMAGIFQEAFGAAIDKGILVGAGSGSDMLGAFIASASGVTTSQDVTATGSAAAPTWADYAGILMTLLSLNGNQNNLALVVHPSIISAAGALGSTSVGDQPLKQEFLNNRSILGVPVILSSHALTTLTQGSYVAVAGYWDHYALAVAQEITIDQIKTVGSDNVTFQSFMYMQGKPLIGPSFRRLKTG